MKMKYKRVTDFSTERTKVFKHLLSSLRGLIHKEQEPKSRDIFTLPSHALPSQFRSLLPVKDAEIERLLTLERRRRLIWNATLVISAIIVVFIIVIITLIIVIQMSLDGKEGRGRLRLTAVHVNRTHFHVDEIKLLKTKALVKTGGDHEFKSSPKSPKHGVQCTLKCWEYAAFRFKAECVNGHCLCRDKNYDSHTCLPKTGDCSITRHRYHPSFLAVRYGRPQTLYSCAPKKRVPADESQGPSRSRSSPENHVISILGADKVTKSTSLHFKSSSTINATIILVSYEPVTWSITLDNTVYTENIVLISHYGVSRTQVKFTNNPPDKTGTANKSTPDSNISPTPSSVPPPHIRPAHDLLSRPIQITRLLIRTGYGDDRDSGNTPFLLGQITQRLGPIASFFGVAHADSIVFDIGLGNYELNSMDVGPKDVYKTTRDT